MATVLQTVAAWMNGNPLPLSTGQVIDQSQADHIIANNKRLAAALGYTVNPDGSFTDPTTHITILQSYVPAAPFYDIPPHPMCGGSPPMPNPVMPDTFDAQTAKVFVWGQSIAANNGRGRYAGSAPRRGFLITVSITRALIRSSAPKVLTVTYGRDLLTRP